MGSIMVRNLYVILICKSYIQKMIFSATNLSHNKKNHESEYKHNYK